MNTPRSRARIRPTMGAQAQPTPPVPQEDTRTLKVYYWPDVFEDYTSGIAVAIAYSKEEAIELCADDYLCGVAPEHVRQELRGSDCIITDLSPQAFTCAGGG